MYLEENTDARLTDVRIEDCEALVAHCCASGLGGGGMFVNKGSTLHAERVHMARCRAPRTGGSALMLAEDTTTFSMVSRISICFILGDVAIVERHLIGVADADACSFLVATTVGIGCLVRIYFAVVERHCAVHYVNASSSLVKRSKL